MNAAASMHSCMPGVALICLLPELHTPQAHVAMLQVIMAFVDNWVEGVDLYNQFAGVSNHVDFFTNPAVKQLYKNNAKALTGRVNTINGRTYSEDPTIFAWDLINEPRCNTDCPAGTIAVISSPDMLG